MKVVLFCGGQGMRLRDFSETVPKPMIPIGPRPILWHVMKYYAHYGHTDFILCLGYKAEVIKEFFLRYEEALSNDFVLSRGGGGIQLLSRDIQDWNISFVDTSISANIGSRLRAVKEYVEDEEIFLANYSDGLTDLHLPSQIDAFREQDAVGSMLAVRPPQSYHLVHIGPRDMVTSIAPIGEVDLWINGGYFVFRPEIFDYFNPGEDLAAQPFQRLIEVNKLMAYPNTGFWAPMDTFKERQWLEDLYVSGNAPWEVWEHDAKVRLAKGSAKKKQG